NGVVDHDLQHFRRGSSGHEQNQPNQRTKQMRNSHRNWQRRRFLRQLLAAVTYRFYCLANPASIAAKQCGAGTPSTSLRAGPRPRTAWTVAVPDPYLAGNSHRVALFRVFFSSNPNTVTGRTAKIGSL